MLKFGTGQGQAGVHERQPLILDREAELAAVTAAITAATGGRGTLVVVHPDTSGRIRQKVKLLVR